MKICGITSAEDAALAVNAGADALGVVFADSPRQVTVDEAVAALADVPPFVARVGVFVDSPLDFVSEAVERAGLTCVQFHGDETPEECQLARVPVVKAFRVGTVFDEGQMEPYRGQVAAVLLDTYVPDTHGGTGKTFAWDSITELSGWAPIVLAGGLDPTNVRQAVQTAHPFAVDVSSGVEARPRHKDPDKINEFIDAVRRADQGGLR